MSSVKKDFKKGITSEDGRRRREEKSLAIRKDKKEEGLSKRRNMAAASETPAAPVLEVPTSTSLTTATAAVTAPVQTKFVLQDIPRLMQGLMSNDTETQVQCLRGFRKLLSVEANPPVQECIDCGALPLFVQCLQRVDSHQLQFEAAWALTNIASTDRTRVVVEYKALPHLVQLLVSPSADVREQSAWCLGNIAGDGHELRDMVLSLDAVGPLVANVANPANLGLLRNCTWALSNFCRGKPQPASHIISPALPVLASILMQCTDHDTITDATWALSYLSDGDNNRIQSVVALGVIPALVGMLQSNKNQLIVPALRTLGNIVSGNDLQTQAVLDANALRAITPLLTNAKKNIRKESCWLLSNIAAGTQDQLATLLQVPDLLPRVLDQMSPSAEWDVRKEASWIVSNLATGGRKRDVSILIEHGAIRPVCELLDVGDVRMLALGLDALESILKVDSSDRVIKTIDESGGIDKLEQLQEHEDESVYKKAVNLLEKYFGGEADNESENLVPTNTNQATFSFGLPADSKFGGFGAPTAAPSVFNFGQPVAQQPAKFAGFSQPAFQTNAFQGFPTA